MAEDGGRRPGVLQSAGRSAISLLRHTRQRAKMGTLHLPISLHPQRQPSIVLPAHSANVADDPRAAPAMALPDTPRGEELRALRRQVVTREQRIARLRHALERERQSRAHAALAVQEPRALIDHLVADLGTVDSRDADAVRRTVTSVLGAYGFYLPEAGQRLPAPSTETPVATSAMSPPSIPGWDRQRLQNLARALAARDPEIGGVYYLYLSLETIATRGACSAVQIASLAGLSSPLAKRRLRLSLEALLGAGVLRRDGQHFVLAPAGA